MKDFYRTYQDVSRELSEGLSSGSVVLEEDEQDVIEQEVGAFAALVLSYLSPRTLVCRSMATSAAGVARPGRLEIEIPSGKIEDLPNDIRQQIERHILDLRKSGVELVITNSEKKTLAFEE